ncbi:MAG: hypothetical protein JW795_12445 [Chitinivibrionales bacterium]|nr:hypothetical protein [Chitinivibrionales bacterium]
MAPIKCLSNTRGSMILTALIILMILSIGSLSTLSYVMKSKQNSTLHAMSMQSFYAAEAGLVQAIELLKPKTAEQFYTSVIAASPLIQSLSVAPYCNVQVRLAGSVYNNPLLARGYKLQNETTHIGVTQMTKRDTVTFTCVGSAIQMCVNNQLSPYLPVYAYISTNNGSSFSSLFPNSSGTNQKLDTTVVSRIRIDSLKNIVIRVNLPQYTWQGVTMKAYTSTSNNSRLFIMAFRRGDTLPALPRLGTQAGIKQFLRKYIDNDSDTLRHVLVNLKTNQVLLLCELNDYTIQDLSTMPQNLVYTIDYQDAIILATFGKGPTEGEYNDNFTITSTASTPSGAQTSIQTKGWKSYVTKEFEARSWKEVD